MNFQIGKTKVFLRAGQMAELDARRNEVLGLSAKKIQRAFRTHLARKNFILIRETAINLQAACRGKYSYFIFSFLLLFSDYRKTKSVVTIKIYPLWECNLCVILNEGRIARQFYDNIRRESASVRIQTCFRMHLARKDYKDICAASVAIQSGMRGMFTRKELHRRQERKAAVIIQVDALSSAFDQSITNLLKSRVNS